MPAAPLRLMLALALLAPGCELESAAPPPVGQVRQAEGGDSDEAMALAGAASEAYRTGDYLAAKRHLEDLNRQYPESNSARFLAPMAKEVALTGAPAPALDVERWLDDAGFQASTGSSVIVFFEPWCPHSGVQLPRVVDMARSLDVRVAAVTTMSRGSTEEGLRAFLDDAGVDVAVGIDSEGRVADAWAVSGPPAAAVVVDGRVVWRGNPRDLSPARLESYLRQEDQ